MNMDCIICNENDDKKKIIRNPSLDSLEKLLKRGQERAEYKDNTVFNFIERTKNVTAIELFQQNAKYHDICYANFANNVKLKRAKKRYLDSVESGESSAIKRKSGRPSLNKSIQESSEGLTTRSKSVTYNKALCIICQEPGGKLHCVLTKETGNTMLKTSASLLDKSFFRRLNNIPTANDAIANDVMYHNNCWVDAKRKAAPKPKSKEKITRTLSDMELVNFIETNLVEPNIILDMNILEENYKNILIENGENEEDLCCSYKKHIKDLIEKNVPCVIFVKAKQKNKPELLTTTLTQVQALDMYKSTITGEHDIKSLWKLAKKIRHEVMSEKWEFTGNFDGFKTQPLLSTFLKWVLLGPHTSLLNENKRLPEVEKLMQTTSQYVMQNIRTSRQTNYQLTTENAKMYSKIETPLNVGLGLYVYQLTRSKKLVKFLSDLNIGIDYNKVSEIKKGVVQAVLDKKEENNDVFVPSIFTKNQPVYFAIDNIDLAVDTPDGKSQLHGTAIAVYQQKSESTNTHQLLINRHPKEKYAKLVNQIQRCNDPGKLNASYESYYDCITKNELHEKLKHFSAWTLLKTLSPSLSSDVPVWAAYNSLLGESKPLTSVTTLPVINGSPTEWDNLYTAIKEAEKTSNNIFPNGKTIISFDLQLYIKAIKLQAKRDVKNGFVFRMGELHVVFCVLKTLGKMIDDSGLDLVFQEAGIYGPATMAQIKNGKHMYRALEAHFGLYLAFFKLYIQKLIDENLMIEKDLKEGVINQITNATNYSSSNKDIIQNNHNNLLEIIDEVDLLNLQNQFDGTLTHQSKYYRNYMSLFEKLLLFIRASREQSWILHLNSLHALCPYFFAFDMLNYARMTPVYLSQMFELQNKDPSTWRFLENGNFSVNKSHIPFSAIGADHGIEQENRAFKVIGGIKGIANYENALNEYFLTAAELGNIVESFCKTFNIEEHSRKIYEHYQLTGSKNKRMTDNVSKISKVFETQDVNFDRSDGLFNIFTKKYLPDNIAERFLAVKELGQEKYDNFVNEKLEGQGSIWDTIKKEKMGTFVSNNKQTTVTIDNQIIHIKEERKLMTRFLVASRTRPDIDLPKYLGMYEFSVVPRSLFASDGTLHQTNDKASIAGELRKCVSNEENQDEYLGDNVTRRIIIFDGMAIVNKINIKKSNIKDCKDFAASYVSIINQEAQGFDEVRVIFDRYEKLSLKSNTRAKRTNGYSVKYKVSDTTQIGHLMTKQFLSSIETKNELTSYLSLQLQNQLVVDYAIVYGKTCITNISDLNEELKNYTHEEADTGIVLHAIDVSKRNPFSDLVISCSDTDVLLILLHYFDEICSSTVFKTTYHKYPLRLIHEELGTTMCRALLGFHAITGCDQTGRFFGHSKLSCWKKFMTSSSETIEAFTILGETESAPTDTEIENLEKFVIRLYAPSVSTTTNDLAELRWYMFSKQQLDSQKLPPTSDAFKLKILRAHFTALQWKSSHLSSPIMPNPEDYGWKLNSESSLHEARMTTLPPAPLSVIDLSICRCKTGCSNLRCKCRKNGLKCSDMCLCCDCVNKDNDEDLSDIELENDDEMDSDDD